MVSLVFICFGETQDIFFILGVKDTNFHGNILVF